jgi:low affinity Fe/Cu permease
MGPNAAIVLQLLVQGATALQQYTLLLQNAKNAGRDVTDAELDELVVNYGTDHAKVVADIKAAGG